MSVFRVEQGREISGELLRGCLVSYLTCHSLPHLKLGRFDQLRYLFGVQPQLWQNSSTVILVSLVNDL
jgi:hypothetical protein